MSDGRQTTHFGPEHQAMTLAERAERDAEEFRQFIARTALALAADSVARHVSERSERV